MTTKMTKTTTKPAGDPWAHMFIKKIDGVEYELITAKPMGGDPRKDGKRVQRILKLKRNGRLYVQDHFVDGTYGPAIYDGLRV